MRNLRLVHSNGRFDQSHTGSPTAHDAVAAGLRPSRPEPRRGGIDYELPSLDPAVQAMVERVRVVASLPPVVRARAIARARAAIAAHR